MRKRGLAPVVGPGARVLILGSFPGEQSLRQQEYYANRQNKLWDILSRLRDDDFDVEYTRKLALLRKHKIALWDVIESCERNGSSDSAIRNPVGNDIPGFLNHHRGIRCILLNGRTAEQQYIRLFPDLPPGIYVPSSSPAHAVSLADKAKAWRKALPTSFQVH